KVKSSVLPIYKGWMSLRLLAAGRITDQTIELVFFGWYAINLFIPRFLELERIQFENLAIALPRLGVVLRIGEDHGEFERVRGNAAIAFLQPHFIRMWITKLIEPGPFVEPNGIHDERIVFPSADRVTVPLRIQA